MHYTDLSAKYQFLNGEKVFDLNDKKSEAGTEWKMRMGREFAVL